MLIREFANDDPVPDSAKLLALTKFLSNRANDESARKEISKSAFIEAANSLGINITPDTLGDLVSQEPLKNVLEPLEPNSNVVRFKGNTDTEATTGMSVDQARAVVDSNAKAAMKRRK
jgi:hypothetical protein